MAAVESKKDLRLWDLILNVAIAGITQGGFSWVGVCLNCKTRVCDVVLLNWFVMKMGLSCCRVWMLFYFVIMEKGIV